jgi:hypothetical protein
MKKVHKVQKPAAPAEKSTVAATSVWKDSRRFAISPIGASSSVCPRAAQLLADDSQQKK